MKNLIGKSFEAYELEWDTEYFELRSARAVLTKEICGDEQNVLINYLKDFEFVTIVNKGNNSRNNIWLGKETKAFLTDMNIQFIKTLTTNIESIHSESFVYESYPRDERIVEVAQKAFSYSRFFNDPWLPKDKARNIYVHWINSAFNKPERFFTIVKIQGDIAGFLLFSMNNETSTATIELIAVDQKYRSRKIGKSLVAQFESYVSKRGIETVKAGTQIDNVPAAKFYNTCGFYYDHCSSIYHYWPRK